MINNREAELKPRSNFEEISMKSASNYEVATDFYLPLSVYSKPINGAKPNQPDFLISGETLSKNERQTHVNTRFTITRPTKTRITGKTKITNVRNRKFKRKEIKIDLSYGQVYFKQ